MTARGRWATSAAQTVSRSCAKSETETVDAALDAIAFRKELADGVRRLRLAGGLKDIYKD